MKVIILETKGDLSNRIDFLTKLFDNAEIRILHSDSFRQKNINYALIVFAALFVLGVKTDVYILHIIISSSLFLLMIFFAAWDRRWHRTKHGWEYSRNVFREKLVILINDPKIEIDLLPYYAIGEEKAEFNSMLPILYYILISGSIVSFFLYKFIQ